MPWSEPLPRSPPRSGRCSAVFSPPTCSGGLDGGRRVLRDVPYTGERGVDGVGSALSVLGMGGLVLGILAWQEGGESVGVLMAGGLFAVGGLGFWLGGRLSVGTPGA